MKVTIARSDAEFAQLEKDVKSAVGLKSLNNISDLKEYRIFVAARSDDGGLMGIASVNEESFHEPGFVGIGLIEIVPGWGGHDVATAIIAAIFRYAKSVNKGVRNSAIDPTEKWHINIYRKICKLYPTVPFIQA